MKTFARQCRSLRNDVSAVSDGGGAGLDHASVISSLLEAVVVVSQRRGIEVANPAARELLELEPDQLNASGGLEGVLAFTDVDGTPLSPGAYPDRIVARTGRPVSGMSVGYTLADGSAVHLKCNAVMVNGTDADDPSIVVSIRDITERYASWRRLSYAAHHDLMTGLFNRTAALTRLHDTLGAESRSERSLAVMFIDLDQMKRVNDTLGHADGDRALIAVAMRIRELIPEPGFVGRLGGDEFIAVADCEHPSDVARISAAIHERLCEPVDVRGRGFVIRASVGLARIGTDEDRSAPEIIRDADAAMYAAKMAGGGHTVDFDSLQPRGIRSIGA
jgi:diguanylate cyclase (GGDEF)-like protein